MGGGGITPTLSPSVGAMGQVDLASPPTHLRGAESSLVPAHSGGGAAREVNGYPSFEAELIQGLQFIFPRENVFAASSVSSRWLEVRVAGLWRGGCVSRAGDEVVVWCTANAGALALLKVAEGINQGRISLSCPWCYLLLWKVSKLWLHNYDSFPQASVSTV